LGLGRDGLPGAGLERLRRQVAAAISRLQPFRRYSAAKAAIASCGALGCLCAAWCRYRPTLNWDPEPLRFGPMASATATVKTTITARTTHCAQLSIVFTAANARTAPRIRAKML